MFAGTRARSADGLAEIINQTLDKFEKLHAAITHDEILTGKSGTIVEPIAIGPKRLRTTIIDAPRVAGRTFCKICAISITGRSLVLAAAEADYRN